MVGQEAASTAMGVKHGGPVVFWYANRLIGSACVCERERESHENPISCCRTHTFGPVDTKHQLRSFPITTCVLHVCVYVPAAGG